MIRKLFAIVLFCVCNFISSSQVFQDVTESWSIAALNASSMYGNGASAYDVNEDGWDDLTICIAGAPTRLYINNGGTFVLHATFENIYDSKTCLWGDYDEDGDNDLFIIKRDGPSQLFIQTDSLVFVNQTQLLNFPFFSSFTSFGASLGDFNRDAYLDLFIANYGTPTSGGSKNSILVNNQSGSFSISTHGYVRSSFQPVFIDLSKDLYQDIYVINDFRVGNEFYNQTSAGVFEDLSNQGAWGLSGGSFLDAMSNSWCDFDNDADLDLYVTNTPSFGNFLFRNNGSNTFANEAALLGVSMNKWTWSALWLDLENDGWNDLIVAERHVSSMNIADFGNYVFSNNQGQFLPATNTGLSNLPYGFFTSAKGDFDNDGLYDLYLGAESANISRVFRNNSNTTNNYFKCRLKGRLSNRNGIGTHIDYFVNGEHRIHYTQSGENYLNQNSQNLIFGLGQSTVIDSLKLSWISGVVDTYYNVPSNSTQVFVEGETLPVIEASKDYLCPSIGDSLMLSIAGWPNHEWDNGSNENFIWVNAPGVYTVEVGTGFGHTIALSYEVAILSSDDLVVSVSDVACFGESSGSYEVSDSNTGEILLSDSNVSAGTYTFLAELTASCAVPLQITVHEPLPLFVVVDSIQNTCVHSENGGVFLNVQGGVLPYAGLEQNATQMAIAGLAPGAYNYTVFDANLCEASVSFVIEEISAPTVTADISSESVLGLGSIALEVVGNYAPYIAAWESGFIGFSYSGLAQGNYHVSISDAMGCTVDTSYNVLFDFIDESDQSNDFILDWKDGALTYIGQETLLNLEIFNSIGQLIYSKSFFSPSEKIHLNVPPQTLFISSSKGKSRTKVVLR